VSHVNIGRGTSDKITWKSSEMIDNSGKVTVRSQQPMICTADIICPVHGTADSIDRTRWTFFSKEDVNNLIECLNKRGIRESELRQMLLQERTFIVEKTANCPVQKLDRTQVSVV
jgi:hypothetical protein